MEACGGDAMSTRGGRGEKGLLLDPDVVGDIRRVENVG